MNHPARCPMCPMPAGERCRSDVFPVFCRWAEEGTESQRAHIVGRSRLANGEGSPADGAAEFPPLLERAGNLARAVGRFVASGGKVVTPEEQARRLAVCHACPHFSGSKCTICGCVARWKARLATEHCPDVPPRW